MSLAAACGLTISKRKHPSGTVHSKDQPHPPGPPHSQSVPPLSVVATWGDGVPPESVQPVPPTNIGPNPCHPPTRSHSVPPTNTGSIRATHQPPFPRSRCHPPTRAHPVPPTDIRPIGATHQPPQPSAAVSPQSVPPTDIGPFLATPVRRSLLRRRRACRIVSAQGEGGAPTPPRFLQPWSRHWRTRHPAPIRISARTDGQSTGRHCQP